MSFRARRASEGGQGLRFPARPVRSALSGPAPRKEAMLLNWFEAKGTISAGSVEGLNYNAKLTMKKAYGFQTVRGVKIALYHRLGALPEPRFAHEFC